MNKIAPKVTFCFCGLPTEKGLCPRHKDKIEKVERRKIGRYPGFSKVYNGFQKVKKD